MKKASEVLSKTRREALLELSDHLGIECRCRLIKENNFRLHRQSARYGNSLFLPA